ncbi:MAG TPA: GspMb/PilO family protein [Anaerohalosphaeraceae bacterium]|nr:GspMb/PilO family protein [Anaerohalosphaeraceae bacterium]HPP55285.1 GspMb/PilO family protein [Anaerohalosphaeraceae bacterium]
MIFKSRKYWIYVACVWGPWLLLAASFYTLVLTPQTERLKAVHQDLTVSSDRVSVARLASQPDTQQRQQELLNELQQRIDDFLVPSGKQDKVLFEISRLANTAGLSEYAGKTREDVWAAEDSGQTKLKRIWQTITFRGTFQQFASFVNALERSRPTVFVESASIERSRQQSKLHSAKLLVSFLIQPDSSAPAAVSSILREEPSL